jgi:hypothetical protein
VEGGDVTERRGDAPKGPPYQHYRIRVDCTDPSHAGRTVHVDTYIGSRREGEPSGWSRLAHPRASTADEQSNDFHDNIACKLCPRGGAKVSANLNPTLARAFEAIVDATGTEDGGTASVELRTLAAIISKQQASRSAQGV